MRYQITTSGCSVKNISTTTILPQISRCPKFDGMTTKGSLKTASMRSSKRSSRVERAVARRARYRPGEKILVVLRLGSRRRAAAVIYSLIFTAKMNDIDPPAWLADVLERIAEHPVQKLDELLPRIGVGPLRSLVRPPNHRRPPQTARVN